MSLRVVVCGAGSTGRHVASVLADVHAVTLVDRQGAEVPKGVRFVLLGAPSSCRIITGALQANGLVVGGPKATYVEARPASQKHPSVWDPASSRAR